MINRHRYGDSDYKNEKKKNTLVNKEIKKNLKIYEFSHVKNKYGHKRSSNLKF